MTLDDIMALLQGSGGPVNTMPYQVSSLQAQAPAGTANLMPYQVPSYPPPAAPSGTAHLLDNFLNPDQTNAVLDQKKLQHLQAQPNASGRPAAQGTPALDAAVASQIGMDAQPRVPMSEFGVGDLNQPSPQMPPQTGYGHSSDPTMDQILKLLGPQIEAANQNPEHAKNFFGVEAGKGIGNAIMGILNSPAADLVRRVGRSYGAYSMGAPTQAAYMQQREAEDTAAQRQGQAQTFQAGETAKQRGASARERLATILGRQPEQAANIRNLESSTAANTAMAKDRAALAAERGALLPGKQRQQREQIRNIRARTQATIRGKAPASREEENLIRQRNSIVSQMNNARVMGQDISGYQRQIDAIDQSLEAMRGGSEGGGEVTEGQTATNPTTGEKIIFQDGQWQPLQ